MKKSKFNIDDKAIYKGKTVVVKNVIYNTRQMWYEYYIDGRSVLESELTKPRWER